MMSLTSRLKSRLFQPTLRQTELLLEDGETIVIGGIIKATVSEGESGIPGLRKIPGLGLLFKYGTKQDQQNELLIFLTPKIIKLAQKEVQSTKF